MDIEERTELELKEIMRKACDEAFAHGYITGYIDGVLEGAKNMAKELQNGRPATTQYTS